MFLKQIFVVINLFSNIFSVSLAHRCRSTVSSEAKHFVTIQMVTFIMANAGSHGSLQIVKFHVAMLANWF